MQTSLDKPLLETLRGQEADAILRKCVHCGFCNATCPTYQITGDELDGPRGRIYLIKQALEGNEVTKKTQLHLDRCLTCLACETTCPSGVEYHRLLDIGRLWTENRVKRDFVDTVIRRLLKSFVPDSRKFSRLMRVGRWFKLFLPESLASSIPDKVTLKKIPIIQHQRKMLVLSGCVQPTLGPNINIAATQVLSSLGINLIAAESAACCGALDMHMSAPDKALIMMKRNIDAWWPYVQDGAEAIVMTASGCGSVVKEYGYYLSQDEIYAQKAARISALTKDISEVLINEDLSGITKTSDVTRVAYHAPCSLQHAQKLTGQVELILKQAGFELTQVNDAHLCCGSAGSYSILQKTISRQLLQNKLTNLQDDQPEVIVTMNIGCQQHMAPAADVPVMHLVELLAKEIP